MISVNLQTIEVGHFPDGTQYILDFPVIVPYSSCNKNFNKIYWHYENDEELVTLIYITRHLQEHFPDCGITLLLGFVPNGRMDRVKSESEVFTLKYFCEVINSLNFDKVIILDPHSNVTPALLNNVEIMNVEPYIGTARLTAFSSTPQERCYFYFPDEGSMKRYGSLNCIKSSNIKILYGRKDRVWETGEIKGLKIYDTNDNRIDNTGEKVLEGKTILMIDDIISYGGTLYHSAKKLKELGANKIYAYATHVENSVLDPEKGTFIKCLDDGTVTTLFTTNSLFSKEHKKIKIF